MKQVKLYNVLFPVWMLVLVPTMWLVVVPGNFLIDSLVLLAGMYALKLTEKRAFYKRNILKIFLFGFLSDIIGAGFMFLTLVLEWSETAEEWYLIVPAILIAAVCIFVLNYLVTFRKEEQSVRFKLALIFAIATAPYTFLIPMTWIY